MIIYSSNKNKSISFAKYKPFPLRDGLLTIQFPVFLSSISKILLILGLKPSNVFKSRWENFILLTMWHVSVLPICIVYRFTVESARGIRCSFSKQGVYSRAASTLFPVDKPISVLCNIVRKTISGDLELWRLVRRLRWKMWKTTKRVSNKSQGKQCLRESVYK